MPQTYDAAVTPERDHPGCDLGPSPVHGSCAGSLIVHLIDRAAAGCTLDEEADGCAAIDLRHEGDPTGCVAEWGGCNHCGVHH